VRIGDSSHTGLMNPEEIGFSGPVPKNNFRRMVRLLFIEFNRSLQGEPPEGTDLRSYPSHPCGAGPSHSRAMGGYAFRRLSLPVTND